MINMNLLIAPFVNALFAFYYWFGNFGWSIVAVTIILRLVLFPLIWPSLKSAGKIRELQPKLNKLKEKYGKDKQALAQAQMSLYKNEGVNPMSGCLPQILQIAVLLLFFSAFNMVSGFSVGGRGKGSIDDINAQLIPSFKISEDFSFNSNFLGSDLSLTPSKAFSEGMGVNLIMAVVLLLGSGGLQFWAAKVMMPNPKVSENIADTTKGKGDDMMSAVRTQSLYMMPLMTIFIGWNFALGLLLYWFTTSLLTVGQQVLVNRMGKK
jgi:YidC/Oxa1 family membrane protein insertase